MHSKAVKIHLLKVGSCRHFECLAIRGGRFAPVSFPALSALIIHPTAGPILFDTGYADHFRDATDRFPERLYRLATPMQLPARQRLEQQLRRHGLELPDIRHCIVSHFHGDHIAGLRDLPCAAIIAMKSGYEVMRRRGRWGGVFQGILPYLLPEDLLQRLIFAETYPEVDLPNPWQLLGRGYDLLGEGSLIGVPLPGHTAGHMGLLVRDEQGRAVLLAADSSWSLNAVRENIPPSRVVRPIIHSWSGYRRTLNSLHTLLARHAELVVLPSHCDEGLTEYDRTWSAQ